MELKPGYKQTEVGVIPEEWEVTSLAGLRIITSVTELNAVRTPTGSGSSIIHVRDGHECSIASTSDNLDCR